MLLTSEDLQRDVSEQAANIDISCYTCNYDDLIDNVTADMMRDLKNWDEYNSLSIKDFWDYFTPYES